MRKLTKKISMLMVLAMLVGLFSGVVSASAASQWAFKSNDIDAAVGATVNLDQDQYENFDLYKNGAIADEATYTITWESSDEDVVWVNAKSGQLRAKKDAADGAEAVITANILNNDTKKTHAVSFTIVVGEVKAPVYTVECADVTVKVGEEIKFAPVVKNEAGEVVKFATHKSYNGYFLDGKAITNPWTPEEAGEYTVTVAQFAAKADVADLAKAVRKAEVKVTVAALAASEIVGAVQKADKVVEITFDEVISEAEAAKIELSLGSVAKNTYKKSVKVDGKVVTFESYASFGNNKVWTFTYGESSYDVTSSQGEVARVEITGPEIFYLKKNGADNYSEVIQYVCYDKNEVKVAKPDSAYIEWKVDGDAVLIGDEISFAESGKKVSISGIYHTGKFDEANNWEEITLPIDAYIVSSAANNDANLVGLGKTGVGINEKYDAWTIPANTNTYKLWVKFLYDDAKASQKTAAEMNAIDPEKQVSYESTDSTKLIVDPTDGTLIPLSQGTVQVLVMYANELYGVVNVNIGPASASTTPAFTPASATISNSKLLEDEKVVFEVKGKDNYNNDTTYAIESVEVYSDPYNPKKDDEKAIKDALVATFVETDGAKLTVNAQATDGSDMYLKTGNYVFNVKVKATLDQKEYTLKVSVFVKDGQTDTAIKSLAIAFPNNNSIFDTAATKTTGDLATAAVSFEIVAKNAAGVAIKKIEEAAVSGTFQIKLGTTVKAEKKLSYNLYTADVNGVYGFGGETYKPIDNGSYVITGKIEVDGKMFTVPNTAFTVKNSQVKPSVSVENGAIELTQGAVESAIETELAKCFKSPDNKAGEYTYTAPVVNEYLTTVSDDSNPGEYSVYVKNVKVTQEFDGGASVDYVIDVNKSVILTIKKP